MEHSNYINTTPRMHCAEISFKEWCIHFQQCRSRCACFLSSCTECFIFDCINITCLSCSPGWCIFFSQCSECLLCLEFEYCLCSFVVYQTLRIYHRERIIVIIIIIIISSSYCYYDRFQVSSLPLGGLSPATTVSYAPSIPMPPLGTD